MSSPTVSYSLNQCLIFPFDPHWQADDFGHNKESVTVLLRKHQTLERDLAALGTKLEQVFAEVCFWWMLRFWVFELRAG